MISENHSGEEVYHHYDGDGNTRQTTDSNDNVLGEATYTAFGETVAESGDMRTTYRFWGRRGTSIDPITGYMSYMSKRNQVYSPSLGRRLSLMSSAGAHENHFSDYSASTTAFGTILWQPPQVDVEIVPLDDNFRFVDGKCKGESHMYWDFQLGKRAPCNGYIIQRIDVHCFIKPCKQGCKKPAGKVPLAQPNTTYYEWWYVEEDNWLSVTRNTDVGTDHSMIPSPPADTCGYVLLRGEVRFYCENAAKDPRPPGSQAGSGPLGRAPVKVPVPKCDNRTIGSGTSGNGTSGGSVGAPKVWKSRPLMGPTHRRHGRLWVCCCQSKTDISYANPSKERWKR